MECDKNKQNIPTKILGIQGTPDIKPTIVNKILSTVYPRPSFSVGVVPIENKPDCLIIVIRVDESVIGPHMFIADQRNRISVRINDTNRLANLHQIEALFERRQSLTIENSNPSRLNDLYVIHEIDGDERRVENFHKIALVPFDDMNIRLDRTIEKEFKTCIHKEFWHYKVIDEHKYHAEYFQVEARNKDID